jgi:hypothetical protein
VSRPPLLARRGDTGVRRPKPLRVDPEFLKQYEPLGMSIAVSESANSGVDLKLIPAL